MNLPYQEKRSVVPALPLPNVILYPKALLPLHIFEPRYIELIQDALEGNKQLALALLKPGWEKDYFGRPEVFPIAGLGEIVHWDKLPGGKFNILVRGLSRVRIAEEFGGGPYRIAQVEILAEGSAKTRDAAAHSVQKIRLLTGLRRLSEEPVNVPQRVEIGHLADIVTIALPIEIYRKQALFEIVDVRKRAERVSQTIDEVLSRRDQLRKAEQFLPSDVRLN